MRYYHYLAAGVVFLFTRIAFAQVTNPTALQPGIWMESLSLMEGESKWIDLQAKNLERFNTLSFTLCAASRSLVIDSIKTIDRSIALQLSQSVLDAENTLYRIRLQGVEQSFLNASILRLKVRNPGGNLSVGALKFVHFPEKMLAITPLEEIVELQGVISKGALQNERSIRLSLPDTMLNPGAKYCQRVLLSPSTEGIVSMQFSLNWNAKKMRMDQIEPLALPGLSLANFGTRFFREGRISFSWNYLGHEPKGYQTPVQTAIFKVCFVTTDTAQRTQVQFSDYPTTLEVEGNNRKQLDVQTSAANLYIGPRSSMWPGDADRNGIVNHLDLLPIGLAYGKVGPRRYSDAINWQEVSMYDWKQKLVGSNQDLKYVDMDGSGMIEANDVQVMAQNFGKKSSTSLLQSPEPTPASGIYLGMNNRSISTGQLSTLPLVLGKNNDPAQSAYGLAFSIRYNPKQISAEKIQFILNQSWLGHPVLDLIQYQLNDPVAGVLHIAISRINQIGKTGFGEIGSLSVQGLQGGQVSTISLENVRMVNEKGQVIPIKTESSYLSITGTTPTEEPAWAKKLHLYPNPAKDFLQVELPGTKIEGLEFYDYSGKRLKTVAQPNGAIPVSDLPRGACLLRIITSEGLAQRQVLLF
jgi:hypothetical protein